MTETPGRLRLGHVTVDPVTMAEAVDRIDALIDGGQGGFVVTPNVDHVVLAEDDLAFRDAYSDASLSLADGMPVVWASRLLSVRVPEKVSGSDLAAPLLARAAAKKRRIYLLGGGNGVAEVARRILEQRYPGLTIVGTSAPMVRPEDPRSVWDAVADDIAKTTPDLVFVCLGAPKQELFMHATHQRLAPAVLLGLGATLDFIAGTVDRAPLWMSRNGLEWAYRLGREPRRMWRRYLVRDPRFAVVLMREMLLTSR